MLDALTNRTRVTTATPLRGVQHDAEVGRELRSAAEPFPLWSSASCAINVLPLKTKIKQRVPGSPSRNCPFELEITFCVRGVLGPPWGVPSTLGLTNPPSITPAFRNARMSFRSRLSSTRLAI